MRSADLLATYLEGTALDLETYEPEPGRTSLVARIEGRDPDAPTLLLMGHTDVVPVNPDGWQRDPFGGELDRRRGVGPRRGRHVEPHRVDGGGHPAPGRRRASGPKGTLIYLAVADEEALGTLRRRVSSSTTSPTPSRADYVITESGGIPIPSPSGLKLPVIVGEKGTLLVHAAGAAARPATARSRTGPTTRW